MENHRCKYIVSCDGLTKGRVKSITTAECIKVLPMLALRQVVENESASSIQYDDPIRSPLRNEHLTQRSRSHYETFQLETFKIGQYSYRFQRQMLLVPCSHLDGTHSSCTRLGLQLQAPLSLSLEVSLGRCVLGADLMCWGINVRRSPQQ